MADDDDDDENIIETENYEQPEDPEQLQQRIKSSASARISRASARLVNERNKSAIGPNRSENEPHDSSRSQRHVLISFILILLSYTVLSEQTNEAKTIKSTC